MRNRSSSYMILLNLLCCYRISTSFSTTGHSFIKKQASPIATLTTTTTTTNGTPTTSSQSRSTVQLQSSINIGSRSRLNFAIPSSDVNESDVNVSRSSNKNSGNETEDKKNSKNNDLDIVSPSSSSSLSPSTSSKIENNDKTENSDTPALISVSNDNINENILSQKRKNIEIEGIDNDNQNEDNIPRNIERDEITNFSEDGLGAYDPAKKLPLKREVLVGDPQMRVKKEGKSVAEILTELAAIQKQGPQKYCILGSRHVSYLHQQIIELLSYALVLSENHVYTSGAMGTNAAAIRGALRAGRPDLLTVILPQSLNKQTDESQELLRGVTDLIVMPQNDEMNLDVASRLCNSKLLSETDQLVAFAFHESKTVIEATKEAKKLEMLVTTLYLD